MKSNPETETAGNHEPVNDPVLMMLGIGKHLWEREPGDSFIERLRAEDEPPPSEGQLDVRAQNTAQSVWPRIESHQGEEFKTARRLPFKYEVEGAGIWFFRDGRRINRKLPRSQVEVAITRCPLTTTTEIKDLMDSSYLWGLLMDPRIRGQAW
jgi:hypothetical protein